MKKLIPALSLTACALMSACTSGDWAKWESLSTPAHVQCFSGGKIIYDGYSNGIVQSELQSDGWYFSEKNTNQLVMVTGSCIIRHETR